MARPVSARRPASAITSSGRPAPSAYVNVTRAASSESLRSAASAVTAARMGPAHGVHTSPSPTPRTRPPPMPSRCRVSGPPAAASRANGRPASSPSARHQQRDPDDGEDHDGHVAQRVRGEPERVEQTRGEQREDRERRNESHRQRNGPRTTTAHGTDGDHRQHGQDAGREEGRDSGDEGDREQGGHVRMMLRHARARQPARASSPNVHQFTRGTGRAPSPPRRARRRRASAGAASAAAPATPRPTTRASMVRPGCAAPNVS